MTTRRLFTSAFLALAAIMGAAALAGCGQDPNEPRICGGADTDCFNGQICGPDLVCIPNPNWRKEPEIITQPCITHDECPNMIGYEVQCIKGYCGYLQMSSDGTTVADLLAVMNGDVKEAYCGHMTTAIDCNPFSLSADGTATCSTSPLLHGTVKNINVPDGDGYNATWDFIVESKTYYCRFGK